MTPSQSAAALADIQAQEAANKYKKPVMLYRLDTGHWQWAVAEEEWQERCATHFPGCRTKLGMVLAKIENARARLAAGEISSFECGRSCLQADQEVEKILAQWE